MTTLLNSQEIQNMILQLPNRRPFMLGQSLAQIYQVEPRQVMQAVKRNPERFPEDFLFQLTDAEVETLKSQNVILHSPRAKPIGFYREGANMLSTVLKSPIAAQRAVDIMRAFSAVEETAYLKPSTETSSNILQSGNPAVNFPLATDLKERLALIETKRQLSLTITKVSTELYPLLNKSLYEVCVRLGEVTPNVHVGEPLYWGELIRLPDGSVPF